jgi:hypothetical protein
VRRVGTVLAAVAVFALLAAPAAGHHRHKHKRHKGPAGVQGVVLDATCPGACAEPPPPEPVYSGAVTIEVRNPSDGSTAASQAISDGHFRIQLRPGSYDVASVPPQQSPSPQPCPAGQMCPLGGTAQPAVVTQCMTGETQHVDVRRHRFAQLTLHVRNTCIV